MAGKRVLRAFVVGWFAIFLCKAVASPAKAETGKVHLAEYVAVSDLANEPWNAFVKAMCGLSDVSVFCKVIEFRSSLSGTKHKSAPFMSEILLVRVDRQYIRMNFRKNTNGWPIAEKCWEVVGTRERNRWVSVFSTGAAFAAAEETMCDDVMHDGWAIAIISDPEIKIHEKAVLPFFVSMRHLFDKDVWPIQGRRGDFPCFLHELGLHFHDAGLPPVNTQRRHADKQEGAGYGQGSQSRAGGDPPRYLLPVVIGSIVAALGGIPLALISGLWRETGRWYLDGGYVGVALLFAGAAGFVLAARASIMGGWGL